MNFRENFKKDMKKCDHHIADLRKQLVSRYAAVEKVRGPGGRACWHGVGWAPAGLRCQGRGLCPHVAGLGWGGGACQPPAHTRRPPAPQPRPWPPSPGPGPPALAPQPQPWPRPKGR